MALAHTILARLGKESFSGYDLWKEFSKTGRYYWQASQQQIYRELRKLEEQGEISSERIYQENIPNKKLYQITDQGIETLKAWLLEPAELMAIREELLVKVIAAQLVPKSVILEEINRHLKLHSQQLSEYKRIEQQQFSDISQLDFEKKCLYATLRSGIRYENSRIAWCEEAISILS